MNGYQFIFKSKIKKGREDREREGSIHRNNKIKHFMVQANEINKIYPQQDLFML